MAGLQSVTIQAASRGEDLESAPGYVTAAYGTAVRNLLPARAGRLLLRGALSRMRVTPYIPPTVHVVAHDANAWLESYNNGTPVKIGVTGTSTFTLPITLLRPAGSYTRLLDYTYGVFNQGNGNIIDKWICRWDGATAIVKYTNGPNCPAAVTSYINRLFVFGGGAPGSGAASFRKASLYWSDQYGPAADTVAAWSDDISGLVNEIQLADEGGGPVGMARLRSGLVLFRENSIYVVSGSTPATLVVRRVASYGCVSARSICEYGDGVFFMSQSGFMYFDGSEFIELSSGIDAEIQAAAGETLVYDAGRGYLFVSGPNLTPISPGFFRLYHVATRSWVSINTGRVTNPATYWDTGNGYTSLFSTPIGNGSGEVFESLATAPELFGFLASAGQDTIGQLTLPVNKDTAIPASFTTRYVKLGTPEKKAKLHRLMCDTLIVETTATLGSAYWSVTVLDRQGAVVAGPFDTTTDASETVNVVRDVFDVFTEVDEVAVRYVLTQPGALKGLSKCEIHDTTLEYQEAQNRTA